MFRFSGRRHRPHIPIVFSRSRSRCFDIRFVCTGAHSTRAGSVCVCIIWFVHLQYFEKRVPRVRHVERCAIARRVCVCVCCCCTEGARISMFKTIGLASIGSAFRSPPRNLQPAIGCMWRVKVFTELKVALLPARGEPKQRAGIQLRLCVCVCGGKRRDTENVILFQLPKFACNALKRA